MLAPLLMAAQVATGQTVATCRVPNDPQARTWSLERAAPDAWRVVFSSTSLDKPRVELPIANATPSIAANDIRFSYKSANGGRSIEWRITHDASRLDLYVNHGLEVNVEPDLDPAVDLMNTDGAIAVQCAIVPAPLEGEPHESSTTNGARGAALSGVPPSSSEWMVSGGVARSVNLFQSTSGRSYAVQTIGWGRDLTPEWGPGVVRGRFAWAVEAMPIFAQFEPSSIYGIGFAPVVWRWNFTPRPRWSAFAELSMGGLWTSSPLPEDTGQGNFTAHWGGGVRIVPRGSPHALVVGYRFQHFSNGNQLGSNPGVNSHVFVLGWSYRS